MTKTKFTLYLALIVASSIIGIQYSAYTASKEAIYRKGVMFGHRCVNALIADSGGNADAAKFFREDAKAFQDYGWMCDPSKPLLLQDR